MSVLLVVVVAAAAIGGVSFLLKFMLTRGIRHVEKVINTAIADTTDIVNDQALPERWHREVTRSARRHPDARRGEAAKRLVLQRLDRLIAQVERGTVMQGETRDFAMERLREVRERWAELGWPEIAAAVAPPSSAEPEEGDGPEGEP